MVGNTCDVIANAARLVATVWVTFLDGEFGDDGE
jgi:hypothetical protein